MRKAMAQDALVLDAAAVEADETHAGGRTHRPHRHGRPRTKPDDVVLGMVERGGGRLKLVPIADAKQGYCSRTGFSLLKARPVLHLSPCIKKHLSRYCDEFSYRFNRRKEQQQLFAQTTKNLLNGKRLTYDPLAASQVSES